MQRELSVVECVWECVCESDSVWVWVSINCCERVLIKKKGKLWRARGEMGERDIFLGKKSVK